MSKSPSNTTKSGFFYDNERIALFIDGANLYAASKALDFDIDYKSLLRWFANQSRLVRAFYYTALVEDQDYSPIRPLVDWLDYNGFTMITKPAREYTDNQGRKKIKSGIDVELAIDMMDMADKVDHIVLFSGDGDLRRLVETVQNKGVRVSVVGSIETNPVMISDELRRQADHFIELDEFAQHIMRKNASSSSDEDEEYAAAE